MSYRQYSREEADFLCETTLAIVQDVAARPPDDGWTTFAVANPLMSEALTNAQRTENP